jgi:hypothetical protein
MAGAGRGPRSRAGRACDPRQSGRAGRRPSAGADNRHEARHGHQPKSAPAKAAPTKKTPTKAVAKPTATKTAVKKKPQPAATQGKR